jgi:hypothetical protein
MMARYGTGTFENVDAFNPRKAGPSNAKPQAVQSTFSVPLIAFIIGISVTDKQLSKVVT